MAKSRKHHKSKKSATLKLGKVKAPMNRVKTPLDRVKTLV